MYKINKIILFWGIAILLASCVVTNNLYVNNPTPQGKENKQSYFGIGSGLVPLNDSLIAASSTSRNLSLFPVFVIGSQIGLAPKTDMRVALHVPLSAGGLGLKFGVQQSFSKVDSRFHMAIGADIGGVLAFNSFLNGLIITKTKGAYNADLFMPFSYTFKNDSKIVFTPRYSFSNFVVEKKIQTQLKVATLGYFINQHYFEISAVKSGNYYYPQAGYAWLINSDN